MKEILEPLLTPGVMTALRLSAVALVLIYLASILWVYRDAALRSRMPWVWVVLGIVPVFGPVIYLLVRPPMYLDDVREQELEIARRERELMKEGYCPSCKYPVEESFLVCPNCAHRLKNQCQTCGQPLNPQWRVCPYCRTRTTA